MSFETLDALSQGLDVPVGDLFESIPDDEMTGEDRLQLKERIEKNRNSYWNKDKHLDESENEKSAPTEM